MRRVPPLLPALLVAALLAAPLTAGAGKAGPGRRAARVTPPRKAIPARYRWKLRHLFKGDRAWHEARKRLLGRLGRFARCKGTLARGPKAVKRCLDAMFAARRLLDRIATYAHRKHDQDTRVPRNAEMKALADKLVARFGEVTSFVEPELLALPTERLKDLIADESLRDYDQYLRNLLRMKPHVLSPGEERVLASTALMRRAGQNIYGIFTTAELPFPEIRDARGKRVRLSLPLYVRYRASPRRAVRKRTFDAFFGAFHRYRRSLAAMLAARVNANVAVARIRRYPSAVAAALDQDNVPLAVYHTMLKAVHQHLPLLHRYLRLRRRLMGLETLHYYDLYPPMIRAKPPRYPYDAARSLLLEALAPLGPRVVGVLRKALDPKEGWVDVYPNQGKRSGAYMDGDAYDVHPYVLLNHLDSYGSLRTLAHEMGHAIHSYLSNHTQPYPKAGYAIFVAEIASTVDEALLMEHMLANEKNPETRLFLLGQRLEAFRQTLFRQAMFAEFELSIYDAAEKSRPLTAKRLSGIYLDLLKRYYGHDKGIVKIDPAYAMEWAYVPHFYYNFYVFQYATGMTAATALAETIRREGERGRRRFVENLLKAGGSDYPIDLVRRAGVDLRKPRAYRLAMEVFERTLAEAEKLAPR